MEFNIFGTNQNNYLFNKGWKASNLVLDTVECTNSVSHFDSLLGLDLGKNSKGQNSVAYYTTIYYED